MKFPVIIFLLFIIVYPVNAQQELEKKLSGEYNPLELVSISQYASFDQAVKMLSAVSELVSGKSIVSTVQISTPIGIEIKKMPYLDALNLIVNAENLIYEDKEGSIVIKTKEKTTIQSGGLPMPKMPIILPAAIIWAAIMPVQAMTISTDDAAAMRPSYCFSTSSGRV